MRVMRCAVIAAVAAAVVLAVAVVPVGAADGVPANVKLCKDFEFVYQGIPLTIYVRSDGSSFANYAECVTYAARGGTVIRRSQFLCESLGGTYVWKNFAQTSFGSAIWTCTHFIITADNVQDVQRTSGACTADALAAGFSSSSWSWTVDIAGIGNIECLGL
jgi:hypothetical protein